MIDMMRPQSEEARYNDENGVETDPVLYKIAKSRGINIKKLLKTLKTHPEELSEKEQLDIIEYSSVVLPRNMERMMIDKYRSNRIKLNELLFLHNTRAATRLATIYNNKYQRTAINRQYNKEDFLAAARYGLWQGATRFDLDRKYKDTYIKFITFATPWMFRYISEMLYKEENMIIHKSLDAKAYDDSDTTFGDTLSDESVTTGDEEVLDSDDSWSPDEPTDTQLVDEENVDFINADSISDTPACLESLHTSDLNSIISAEDESDDMELHAEQMNKRIASLRQLASNRRAENTTSDTTLTTDVISCIDRLCTEILNIRDPQERIVTMFIGRRFIHAVVKHAEGRELPAAILNVNSMLKGTPGNKKKLLECLDIDEPEFNQLCNHYAMNHINKGIQ